MRTLACDLDGVIFKFNDNYSNLIKRMTGIDIPPETAHYPETWYYEREAGVSKKQESEVWSYINGEGNYSFWRFLPAYDGAREFLEKAQQTFENVVFITARSGPKVQQATEDALSVLGVKKPQVIIAHYKPPVMQELKVTDFLDDRDKNMEDVRLFDMTADEPINSKLWLLDRPWNRKFNPSYVTRVVSPMEVLA